MKIITSLKQIIIASVFFVVGIILLFIHVLNPAVDYTKEALMSFLLLISVFVPSDFLLINDSDEEEPNQETFFAIVFIIASYCFIQLGKDTVTSFLFDLSLKKFWAGALQILCGAIVFFLTIILSKPNPLRVKI